MLRRDLLATVAPMFHSAGCSAAVASSRAPAAEVRRACTADYCPSCASPAEAFAAALEHDYGLADGPTRRAMVTALAPLFTDLPPPPPEDEADEPIVQSAGRVSFDLDDIDEEGDGLLDPQPLLTQFGRHLAAIDACLASGASGTVRVTLLAAQSGSVSIAGVATTPTSAPAETCVRTALADLSTLETPPVDGSVSFAITLRLARAAP